MAGSKSLRVDWWLFAARFYRTRALAQAAVRAGHVDLDGRRCKPAQALRAGDRLRIRRGGLEVELEVLALAERRGGATEAQALYSETVESRRRREEFEAQRRLDGHPRPTRRPDKRERRQLRALKS